jgi:hypothetical protein
MYDCKNPDCVPCRLAALFTALRDEDGAPPEAIVEMVLKVLYTTVGEDVGLHIIEVNADEEIPENVTKH